MVVCGWLGVTEVLKCVGVITSSTLTLTVIGQTLQSVFIYGNCKQRITCRVTQERLLGIGRGNPGDAEVFLS
jgi:hypothetical protein